MIHSGISPHVVSDWSRCGRRFAIRFLSFRHGRRSDMAILGSLTAVSDEIGAVATLGRTTGDSRVKYQPTPVVTVGFVVVSIAWRSQWSHNLLGVHRPTVVALLTRERSSCQRCLIHSSGVSLSPTVASLLTTESVCRTRVAAGVSQRSHDLLGVRSFAGSCFSINDGERDV